MANPSDVRVSGGQLLISEFEPVAPDTTEDANDISVTLAAGTYTITDSQGAVASGSCDQGDINTVTCSASVSSMTVQLKGGADRLVIGDTIPVPSTVTGGRDPDNITTGGGADTVRGDAGADTIDTRSGDDSIDTYGETSPEADTITCGPGTGDTARVDGRDGFIPLASRGECETVTNPDQPPPPPPPATGGAGGGGAVASPNQTAVQPVVPGVTPPTTVPPVPSTVACRSQTFVGTTGADRFVGTGGGDRMVGLAGNDLFDGLGGEDCIYGGDGADSMRGGEGGDRLSGGAGNDRGDGGNGADSLYGSAGVDTLYGRAGNDVVSGGLGSDKMFGENGADRMTGSAGNDRISSGAGNDRIVAGTGRDQVYGSAGNDLIDVRDGSRDVVSCGPGRDTVVRDRRDVLRNCERTASRLPRAR